MRSPLGAWLSICNLPVVPGEPALWHLYVEIMSKYSNVILTDNNLVIVTAAHQVSQKQSSVRSDSNRTDL